MTDEKTDADGFNDYEHNHCRVCGNSLVHDRTESSQDKKTLYHFYICPTVRFGGWHDRKVIEERIPDEPI